MGDAIVRDWRERAGATLLAIAEQQTDDPACDALASELETAKADFIERIIELFRDPRFDELPPGRRDVARAHCARLYLRALDTAVFGRGI